MFGLTLLVLRAIVANAIRAGNHLFRGMLRQIVRFSYVFLALVIHTVWPCECVMSGIAEKLVISSPFDLPSNFVFFLLLFRLSSVLYHYFSFEKTDYAAVATAEAAAAGKLICHSKISVVRCELWTCTYTRHTTNTYDDSKCPMNKIETTEIKSIL